MNGDLLSNLTLLTAFLCLGLALWFAIYLLARSHANHLTFRAIVALIALAFYYNSSLSALLAVSPEHARIRSFTTAVALIACHDLTHYMLNQQQRKKLYPLARGIVMFGVVVIILIFTAPPSSPCSPLYICPTTLGYPWLVIDLFKVFIFCSILLNLWLIKKTEGLLNNIAFYLAVMVGISSIAYGSLGTLLNTALPRVLPNLFILGALILLAYSVARDRTFIARRMTTYDLPITLLTICFIVVIYILTGLQLKLPGDQLLLIAVLAIFTHSAYDFVRDFLDRLVHRQERQARQELKILDLEVPRDHSLERYLNRGLAILCYNLRASCGFVAVQDAGQYKVVASLHWLPIGTPLPSQDVALEGLTEPGNKILSRIAWLAPAYRGKEQVAVVGLGMRKDKIPYGEEDLYWLEDVAHEIGHFFQLYEWQKSNATPGPEAAGVPANLNESSPIDQSGLLSAFAYKPDLELVKCIEEGYRHLHDYDELGKSPLVALFGIQAEDHIERGKRVNKRLLEILEKLRPAGQLPPEPIPSEWYAYTILHDSYVEESLSRDIMAKLYIGEGTYYRLRRQALRGITRVMLENGAVA
ncbi:MAG: hypothetical protein ACM3PY_16930, partial [Omnitrophica WOR_2 bacterium]